MQELDILRQRRDRASASASVPKLTEEETRHAASFASTNGSAYVRWLCCTYGHAIYACPFLSPEQQRFTRYRNYKYQKQTRLGMRNPLQQSARKDRFSRQGYRVDRVGALASPLLVADIVVANSTNATDATSVTWTRNIRFEMEGETENAPDSHRGYRTR